MTLAQGDKLGPFEILAPIGAGGMGEVYRARDTRLKRDVALKVLPAAVATNPERMMRFQREAEVLASLNHPNIAALYGIEDRALVMELVEGQNLAGPLPIDTAIDYARQIAEALEYAHERGVVHRDLKPANVKVTPEGVVKLLDFGLAKAIEDPRVPEDPANSPTLTMGATQTGVILGTAAYMAPEQARGARVDKRADIWAFGVVLYEMLTGKRLFRGEMTSDVLASVIKEEPDLTDVPPRLRRLLTRCLTKDPKQRLRDIGEARIALLNPVEVLPAGERRTERSWPWIITASALAIVAAAASWIALTPKPPEPRPAAHFVEAMPGGGARFSIALSRDGSRIAYTADSGKAGPPIRLRTLDEPGIKSIPGTEGALPPSFSPDGQWLVYNTVTETGTRQLNKIRVSGGSPLPILTGSGTRGAPWVSWSDDETLLYGDDNALKRVSLTEGQAETLATTDLAKGEYGFVAPQLLPGGKSVVATIQRGPQGTTAEWRIAALDLRTRQIKTLADSAGIAWYAPERPGAETGYLLYTRTGSLFAIPFDSANLQTGSPILIMTGVLAGGPGAGALNISESGTLAYIPGKAEQAGAQSTLIRVNQHGDEEPLPFPPGDYSSIRISPDGNRVALTVGAIDSGEVWVYDLVRGSKTRIHEKNSLQPVFSFDGKRVFYSILSSGSYGSGGRSGAPMGRLVSKSADGTGEATVLIEEGPLNVPYSVSRDGKLLVGVRQDRQGNPWVMPLTEGAKPEPFQVSKRNTNVPQISPDSRWISYQSNESGRMEVYVSPYPGPGERVTVSTGGGTTPRWSSNGRELFYRDGNKIMVVDVPTGPAFRPGKPKLLFETAGPYDVFPDGRFLIVKTAQAPSQPEKPLELHIIVNWIDQLRRTVAGK